MVLAAASHLRRRQSSGTNNPGHFPMDPGFLLPPSDPLQQKAPQRGLGIARKPKTDSDHAQHQRRRISRSGCSSSSGMDSSTISSISNGSRNGINRCRVCILMLPGNRLIFHALYHTTYPNATRVAMQANRETHHHSQESWGHSGTFVYRLDVFLVGAFQVHGQLGVAQFFERLPRLVAPERLYFSPAIGGGVRHNRHA